MYFGIEALIYGTLLSAQAAAEAAAIDRANRESQYYDAEPFGDVIDVEARVVPDAPALPAPKTPSEP